MYFLVKLRACLAGQAGLGAFVAQFSHTSTCHKVTKTQRNHEVLWSVQITIFSTKVKSLHTYLLG